jgi:hypothetical protein
MLKFIYGIMKNLKIEITAKRISQDNCNFLKVNIGNKNIPQNLLNAKELITHILILAN